MCIIFASIRGVAVAAVLLVVGILGPITAVGQVCTPPPAGMVSWWPGDGNADDIADGNPGTLVNGATFDSGLVDQAFRFTASLNSGVRIASSANLNPTDAITLDAWVFPFSFPNVSPSILRKEGSAGATQYLIAVGNGIVAGVGHCNIGDFAAPTGGTIPLNQWTHVACTYDRQFARLYVNGVEVAAQPRTQPIPAFSSELWIGNHARFIRPFNGLIDEVEIFNRALSPSEIQAIFNAGSAGKCKPGATEPNLVVDKSDSPDPVLAGDKLTYTVDVDNIGTGEATDVTLIDALPTEVTFVSAIPSDPQDTCSESGGTVTCDFGTLASEASASVEITVTTTTTPGTITNTAEVTGNPPDSDQTNNTDTEETTVVAVTCDGLPATIVGTPGDDTLSGTNGADVIHGLSGDDTISGGNGDDRICGGNDNDTLNGGNAIDRLFGDSGADTLNGNNGNDALDGGADTDTCNGGTGSDTAAGCEAVTSVP